MDIQFLSMQNVFYRDLIDMKKREINDLDKKIQINEMMIGSQLGSMEKDYNSGVPGENVSEMNDCTLCMGECSHG